MIKLAYDNGVQIGDLVRSSGNLETDEGLETAVTISLFTDARAREGDDGIDPNIDPRGWCLAQYLEPDTQFGSRLWELRRGKVSTTSSNQSVQMAKEALQWIIDAGVALTIQPSATRLRPDTILLTVDIQRSQKLAPRWSRTWEVQLGL